MPPGRPFGDGISHCVAYEHLAAMPDGHESCDAINRRPVVVRIALNRGADVNAHAHAETADRREIFRVHALLAGKRCLQCLLRRAKRRAERVADRLEDEAAVSLDLATDEYVVPGDRLGHRSVMVLPAMRTALDVGKEKRHRASRHGDRILSLTLDFRRHHRMLRTIAQPDLARPRTPDPYSIKKRKT